MAYRDKKDYSKAQFGALRDTIDHNFMLMHCDLSDAYYGTPILNGVGDLVGRQKDGWKHGISNPVTIRGHVFDKKPTPAESKVLFDKIHGLIYIKLHDALLAKNAIALVRDRIPLSKLDPEFETEVDSQIFVKRSDSNNETVQKFITEGVEI